MDSSAEAEAELVEVAGLKTKTFIPSPKHAAF